MPIVRAKEKYNPMTSFGNWKSLHLHSQLERVQQADIKVKRFLDGTIDGIKLRGKGSLTN